MGSSSAGLDAVTRRWRFDLSISPLTALSSPCLDSACDLKPELTSDYSSLQLHQRSTIFLEPSSQLYPTFAPPFPPDDLTRWVQPSTSSGYL